jgi:OmpA-OmpF porin, OOP family
MKHLNKLLSVVFLFVGLSSQAQDVNNPWAISFGANAVDGARVSAASKIEDQFSQYFDAKRYWNILPSVSYLNVSKNVGGNFSVGITGSVNKINKFVGERATVPGDYPVGNPGDLAYYAADGVIKYSLASLLGWKMIEPSAHVGGGYTSLGDASYGTVNGGLGLTFWFTEMVGLSLNSSYKYSMENADERGSAGNVPTHMQHFAGLTFKFGGKDTDGDGIYDKDDACPDVAGLKQFQGCPDTDADGIVDSKDSCVDVFGLAALNGCPDTDGDGIADKDDACPEVAGLAGMNGCPDSDGDGVTDLSDKCPTVKGAKDNAGCPYVDTDGDTVLDKDDKCPTVKGTVGNKGCPEAAPVAVVPTEAIKRLNDYAKTILFDTSKSTFQKQTYPVLVAITSILKEYPAANFSIEGHTDSDGADAANQTLSDNRAAAVKNYLIDNGIASQRLSSRGFGEGSPIDTNATKAGKANNRRVEVKLVN